MNKIIKAICAVAVILSFSLGVLGLFAPDSVMAANLGQTSVIYDGSYVSWVTSYGLPVSVQGTLQSQGITIRSSNTSVYSVDGNGGFMCISAGRESPTGTTGTLYRCVNTGTYDYNNDSLDAYHHTLRVLNGLTYSQIAYGCYMLGRNGGSSWAYSHAILSYLIGEDPSWFGPLCSSNAYSSLTTFAAAAASVASGCAPDKPFYVFISNSGKQNLIALDYNPPATGSVSFNKTDGSSALSGAVIRFLSSAPGAFERISVRGVDYASVDGGIEFTTTGSVINISGLKSGTQYVFREVTAPSGFELAEDITVTVDSNGNVSNSADFDNSVVMVDGARPSGAISFNKIDAGTNDDQPSLVRTAGIEFRAAPDNTVVDAMSDLTIEDMTATASYDPAGSSAGYPRIVFTASAVGTDIRIDGLKPGASYVFHEYSVPEGYSASNDITVRVLADGSCMVNGQNTGMVTMTNRTLTNLMGSIGVVKRFDNTDPVAEQQFWSDVSQVDFQFYAINTTDWDIASSVIYSGYWPYVTSGKIQPLNYDPSVNPTLNTEYAEVWWNAGDQSGNPNLGNANYANYYYPGRWWMLYSQAEDRWITQEYSVPVMQSLPDGYYMVSESWQEGMFETSEQESIYISTLNASGWRLYSNVNGYKTYVQIYKVLGSTTYLIDWDTGNPAGTLSEITWTGDNPNWNYSVTQTIVNAENTGACDVVKTDATGGGVDGISFELWRGASRYATGHISSLSGPEAGPDGVNTYQVDWNYVTRRCVDVRNDIWVSEAHNNSAAVYSLNYGTYQLREIIPSDRDFRTPEGWSAMDQNADGRPEYFYRNVQITSDNQITPATSAITNREYRLNISVYKEDASSGTVIAGYQGSTLTAFNLYWDSNSNGIIDDPDVLLGTSEDDDRDGTVSFNYSLSSLFPDNENGDYPTRYLVLETAAPDGYYLNTSPVPVSVDREYNGTAVVTDIPYVRINFNVNKYDEWTSQILSGYDGDRDAAFSLYCDVNMDGALDEGDVLMDTLSDQDRDGRVTFTYTLNPSVIATKFPGMDINDPLMYPTHYLIVEDTAPHNYLTDTGVHPVVIPLGEFSINEETDIYESPYTGHIRIFKYDSDTQAMIPGAIFTIYNDVDEDQRFTYGTDTVAVSYVDGSLAEASMVWNNEERCYVSTLLRAGSYVVVETGLPEGYFYTDSAGDPSLIPNEVFFRIEEPGSSEEDSLSMEYEAVVYNIKPLIHTNLTNNITHSHIAPIGQEVELIDTVSYVNLVPDEEYVLTGTLIDKGTGAPVTDSNGNPVTAVTRFDAESPSGTVEVVFTVDTQRLIDQSGQVRELVAFEDLALADGRAVCDHRDINDAGQTVRIGQIRTCAVDSDTNSQITSDGLAVIIDYVHYEGLLPGQEYTVSGTMHLAGTDDSGNRTDEGAIREARDGEELAPQVVFTPETSEGFVEVTYVIDTSRFKARTLVCFESLSYNGAVIMTHADIDDENQTIYVPSVRTSAYSSDTMSNVVSYGKTSRITDTVFYENVIPGLQYTVSGSLYYMYTDENGYIHTGSVASVLGGTSGLSSRTFVAEQRSGTIDIEFTVDTTVLSGLRFDKLIVMEDLIYNGVTIASHIDLNDEAQSVYIPGLRTTASDGLTGGKTITETQDAEVIDRVFYTNLEPGREYTVVGSVQYVVSDPSGAVLSTGTLVQNGVEIRSQKTFVPDSSDGFIDLVFELDGTFLNGIDKLVVYEDLYAAPGVRIATHADLNDEDQTVEICDLSSLARGTDGGRSVASVSDVRILESVFYDGLIPGREYRLETDVMNTATGASDMHLSTVFVPEDATGTVDLELSIDGSGYSTEKLVIFESVYDNSSGALVKSHCDWNEKSQTISFMPQTGSTGSRKYRSYGCFAIALGAGAAMCYYMPCIKRKKTARYDEHNR